MTSRWSLFTQLNKLCCTKYDDRAGTLVYCMDVRSVVHCEPSRCILIILGELIMRKVGLNFVVVRVISSVCLFVIFHDVIDNN